jgi:hypothetical protein
MFSRTTRLSLAFAFILAANLTAQTAPPVTTMEWFTKTANKRLGKGMLLN